MRKLGVVFGALIVALPVFQAYAEEPQLLPPACFAHQSANVLVQFGGNGPDGLALKKQFDQDIKDIQSLAAGIGATQMVPGNMNYGIQAQSANNVPYDGPALCLDCFERTGQPQDAGASGISFTLTGNVNFSLEPPSRALELLKALLAKKYAATLHFVQSGKDASECRLNVSTGKWE